MPKLPCPLAAPACGVDYWKRRAFIPPPRLLNPDPTRTPAAPTTSFTPSNEVCSQNPPLLWSHHPRRDVLTAHQYRLPLRAGASNAILNCKISYWNLLKPCQPIPRATLRARAGQLKGRTFTVTTICFSFQKNAQGIGNTSHIHPPTFSSVKQPPRQLNATSRLFSRTGCNWKYPDKSHPRVYEEQLRGTQKIAVCYLECCILLLLV